MTDINNNNFEDLDHENKQKMSSPPNSFIQNNTYVDSFETSFKKLHSDSTSVISSSSDNDSISDKDSERINYRMKINKPLHKILPKGPRSRSLFQKKTNYLIDVVNEDASENEIEKDSSMHKKYYTTYKLYNNMINNNYNTYDSIKITSRLNSDKMFKSVVMEPLFEVKEEVEKLDNNKNLGPSPRIKLIKDSKEEDISNTNMQFYSSSMYDQISETIAEDNNENVIDHEIKSKTHKKIENFTDKMDDIDEINNELIIDTENIEAIKEENNEDDEYNTDKLNNSGYLQFCDDQEKINLPKHLPRIPYSAIEQDQIIENIDDLKNDNDDE